MLDWGKIKSAELMTFDSSGSDERFLLSVNGRYFEVNSSIARLVYALKSSSSLQDLSHQYSTANGRTYSPEELEVIVSKYILPMFVSAEEPYESPLIFRKEILSENLLEKFSNLFKCLFDSRVMMSIGIVTCALESIYFYRIIENGFYDILTFGGTAFVFVFLILFSFFHEIGHAASCKYYGADHGGIGLGFYLNFPVFYTDVSNIWTLPRKQRLVVNIAGVYFQFAALVPVIILYLITGSGHLKYFILMVNINALVTLNPFFKYDGYWIVSDLLGVANLRARSVETIRYILKKLFNRIGPEDRLPFFGSVKKPVRVGVIIYAVIVNLFFAVYFLYVIPKFIIDFVQIFPGQLCIVLELLAGGTVLEFSDIQGMVSRLLFLFLIIFLIYKTFRTFFNRNK